MSITVQDLIAKISEAALEAGSRGSGEAHVTFTIDELDLLFVQLGSRPAQAVSGLPAGIRPDEGATSEWRLNVMQQGHG